jgi:hypothetical protein
VLSSEPHVELGKGLEDKPEIGLFVGLDSCRHQSHDERQRATSGDELRAATSYVRATPDTIESYIEHVETAHVPRPSRTHFGQSSDKVGRCDTLHGKISLDKIDGERHRHWRGIQPWEGPARRDDGSY